MDRLLRASFLMSLFCEHDANHKSARDLVSRFDGEDFVLCQAHQIEFPAAVRSATHRGDGVLREHVARTMINRFDRAWNGRQYLRRSIDLDESAAMVRTLGDTHGWNRRHTAFDLWHLAAAWTLGAGVFLTFDARQQEVCRALAFRIS